MSTGELGVELACELAQGIRADDDVPGTVLAVFASPVATQLGLVGSLMGWRCLLFEPDAARLDAGTRTPFAATLSDPAELDLADVDVVVTDHDRPELGRALRDLLAAGPRWVGVVGSRRHAPSHVPALRALGVDEADIASVHRPIGLDIGSRTPPEIAVSTMAGLLADRRGRGGT